VSVTVCFKKKPTSTAILTVLLDRTIQLVTGKYIHQELLFSDGRCFSSRDNGPEWCDQREVGFLPGDWDFIKIPCSAEQEAIMVHQADIIVSGAFTGIKPKYGWLKDIVGFLPMPVMIQDPKIWFCSEVCCVLIQCLGMLLGYTTAGISPTQAARYLSRELPLWIKAQK